jgi:hypothetical protein
MGEDMTSTRHVLQYFIKLALTYGAISPLLVSAEIPRDADFADMIRTPAGIQNLLERCDAHPVFETVLANWLEMAEPASPEDRQAIRKTSLRLLEDTNDPQLVLGLTDGLLRHALEDIKRDPAIVPEEFARALYADIAKAVRAHRSKVAAVLVPAYGLLEDGTVKNERQASFIEDFLNFADSRLAHRARPPRRLGNSADNSREQSDLGSGSRR